MKITNKISEAKSTRYISTCYPNEAFLYADEWYTLVQANFDAVIDSRCYRSIDEFIEKHLHEASCDCDLLPCINLATMGLFFIEDAALEECAWANVEAILTARS